MLMDRIMGALTFRSEVYADVEQDTTFTQTAWMIVAGVALLASFGAMSGRDVNIVGWLVGSIVTAVFSVGGFAVGAFVISWVGQTLFNADVSFEEMVRTLGLAYIWRAVGVLGVLGFALSCLLAPVRFLAWLASLAAALIAAKEALDLEWGETVVTVLAGWVVMFLITAIAGLILGLFGMGAAAAGSLLGG